MARQRLIYLMLCGVIILWGLNVVMVKYLSFFPPVLIAAIRMSVAALALSPILVAYRGVRLNRTDWLYIVGVSLTSVTMHQILLAWAVQYTTASNTSLILGLNPLVTALAAVPFLGEQLTWRKLVGIACGFSGVLLVVLSSTGGSISIQGWGDLITFASMLMYVAGGLLIRKATMRGVPVMMVTAWSFAFASITLWLISAAIYPAEVFAGIDTRLFTWGVILASGVLSTALGTLGWNYGIRQLGASRTAIFLNGMPLTSLVFAALLLDETLHAVQGLAFLLVVTGVYFGTHPGPSRQPANAASSVPER